MPIQGVGGVNPRERFFRKDFLTKRNIEIKCWLIVNGLTAALQISIKIESCPNMREGEGYILGPFGLTKRTKIYIFISIDNLAHNRAGKKTI